MALTRWSLPRLARHLAQEEIRISVAHPGWALLPAHEKLDGKRDPDYQERAARVLSLYRRCPEGGVVISFDEGDPYSLCPHHGRGWAQRKRPQRLRARFNPRHGVRYLFAAYDVHADYLRARLRPASDVEIVPTPTYASYLNRIECHLGAIGEFVVKNVDYPDWDAFGLAMAEHIRCRKRGAERDERLQRAERRRLVQVA